MFSNTSADNALYALFFILIFTVVFKEMRIVYSALNYEKKYTQAFINFQSIFLLCKHKSEWEQTIERDRKVVREF